MAPVGGSAQRVVVVGGGPGGYESALVAAQLGAEVTVVDRDGLGGAAVLTKTVGAGIALSDPGQGGLTITLARADTSGLTVSPALPAGKGYVWDVKRTDPGHNVVLARGQLILEQEITP